MKYDPETMMDVEIVCPRCGYVDFTSDVLWLDTAWPCPACMLKELRKLGVPLMVPKSRINQLATLERERLSR